MKSHSFTTCVSEHDHNRQGWCICEVCVHVMKLKYAIVVESIWSAYCYEGIVTDYQNLKDEYLQCFISLHANYVKKNEGCNDWHFRSWKVNFQRPLFQGMQVVRDEWSMKCMLDCC